MGLIDKKRFRSTFEAFSEIGATDAGGLHRVALSEPDVRVRDRFVDALEDLDLAVRVDEVGNVFGRREGTDPDAAPVLIGSHLDSQPRGGRFDGQLGVLSALEAVRVLADHDVETRRPVEVVNWTNEEGTRFKPALMGSGAYTGAHDVETVLSTADDDGVTLAEALEAAGYRGDAPVGAERDPHAYLELHVEQGPVLEDRGLEIGIVEGILGMSWLDVTISGDSDHAGPSPTYTRADALVAAADVVTAVRRLAGRLDDDVVTTVGEFEVAPGSINVIPDTATFTVDLRSYDEETVQAGVEAVEREIEAACDREGTSYTMEEIWRIPHTEFSPEVCDVLERSADAAGCSYTRMIGGAGHDASYLADVTDAGLLFVPSVDGKTHNEREFTEWTDVLAGAELFAEATIRLADGEHPGNS
ncbi:hydantoinase/carbamoylase family amidase [Halorubrum sp. JWXQ-INN 858]|uniref:Zn-dependent hydrolase n=1 Tax=Halorubrum sp. JWXQ-INN 858 TaxID=2690782 RepID=UPI00135B52CF|nr:Zn-dependent hydrolase [Halorubrum sp. JWXQ-INN 858]MWV64850.1 hydantoinase/carbamoylase family amidase [Halorubrum sp. JWXQ-INN 858]